MKRGRGVMRHRKQAGIAISVLVTLGMVLSMLLMSGIALGDTRGRSDTPAGGFAAEYPAPTVTSVTPDSEYNDGTVNITDLKGANFREGAQVRMEGPSGSGDAGAGIIHAYNVEVVSSSRITCTFDLHRAQAGSYTVTVTNAGDWVGGSKEDAFTVEEAPPATPTWYLAEGTTDWGYSCYITIQNPNRDPVNITITYMTDSGDLLERDIGLYADSQVTVSPADTLGAKDFSTKVECKESKTIAVDRTMTWTREAPLSLDGHCSIGVTSPAKTWYLAEGSSDWGFECWLLIQNPNATEATAQVTYMIEGAEPQVFEKKIPANRRETYNMADDIGEADASIKVQADIPVIPERAMYRNINNK
ncbi:MAG: IPT/TIG domain-containing protein, partial [Actinobacteria bacterium]|nr:IPT/TIG domain-containing protein [Actinomycetota bacterium]